MTLKMTSHSDIQFSITTTDPIARIKPVPRYVAIDLESLDTTFDKELHDHLSTCGLIEMVKFDVEDMINHQFILLTRVNNGMYVAELVSNTQQVLSVTKGNHTDIKIIEGDIELEDLLCW